MTNVNQEKSASRSGTSRILRIRDVMAKTGISRSSLYQLSSNGAFPKNLQLVPGGATVGWLESEIEEWIEQRISARDLEVATNA